MNINRLWDHLDEPEEQVEADYFVVATRFEEFYISRECAGLVLDALQAREPPRWIRFDDVCGATISLRTALIDYVQECTAEQRASGRRFRRARLREEKADRNPWEDDS